MLTHISKLNYSRRPRHYPLFVLVLLAVFGFGLGHAQPDSTALGKPGEHGRLRLAIPPTMVGSWTGLVAYEKKYWARSLPKDSHVG